MHSFLELFVTAMNREKKLYSIGLRSAMLTDQAPESAHSYLKETRTNERADTKNTGAFHKGEKFCFLSISSLVCKNELKGSFLQSKLFNVVSKTWNLQLKCGMR